MRLNLLAACAAAACAVGASASAQMALPPPAQGGGYFTLSKTVDMAVQRVVVDEDRGLSIVVSVRNKSAYDFGPTPGDFVPTLTLADGEAFTSRELFRPGDPATVFRPTISPGAETTVRFIFRKAKGMAEPKTFTIKAGANPPASLDVSAYGWTSSAP